MSAFHILLCADHPPAVADVHRLFESAGHAVHTHSLTSGVSANGTPPQLMLVDGTTQVEPALNCCRLLRARQGEQYVPILFMAADASPTTRLACLQAGADAC